MTNNIFDVAIIGMGVAGVFAAYKLATEHKKIKVLAIEQGRPPQKRRRQIDGFFGCLPSGDGKLFLSDAKKVADLTTPKKSKAANKYVQSIFKDFSNFKIVKDKGPSISAQKRLVKAGYDLSLNDYVQLYPKDIHALSKYMADSIEAGKNITFSFDNEVKRVFKQKNTFIIQCETQEYKCKRLIICTGRSGWRWTRNLFSNFGIIENNDIAKFGVRLEMQSGNMKDFNKSSCSIFKGDHLEIGPFSWNGTVIPEDHGADGIDLAISAFRSNENRWKSDKVSFSLIGNINKPNEGFEQTDRIGKLTFVLSNDRIVKEKVSAIMAKKSKISIIPEYDWLRDDLKELSEVIPDLLTKAYFHVPTILPLAPKVNMGSNLESEVDGMFIAGEAASTIGILAAANMGVICADAACK